MIGATADIRADMRLGIVLDQELHSGGGFQQSLNAIRQLRRIGPDWMEIEVFTNIETNASHRALQDMKVHVVRTGSIDRVRRIMLSGMLPAAVQTRLDRPGFRTALEAAMLDHHIDLAYFVAPSAYALALQRLPYLYTVWDLCHRDHPEFPEVANGGEFRWRERLFREAVNCSYLCLSDSEELSDRIARRYGADRERLLAMPFQPADFGSMPNHADMARIAARYRLPADYLFYPAQFWPHKNHVRIIQAVARLKERGREVAVVFAGGDKGNKGHVEAMARKFGISSQITFTGFVEDQDMPALYAQARALVMPTYFGPTNLPPLEAWALRKPVIYSKLLVGQAGDAALCVDPDSVEDLADAIVRIYDDKELAADLIAKGESRLEELLRQRDVAEKRLIAALEAFRHRRLCWSESP